MDIISLLAPFLYGLCQPSNPAYEVWCFCGFLSLQSTIWNALSWEHIHETYLQTFFVALCSYDCMIHLQSHFASLEWSATSCTAGCRETNKATLHSNSNLSLKCGMWNIGMKWSTGIVWNTGIAYRKLSSQTRNSKTRLSSYLCVTKYH